MSQRSIKEAINSLVPAAAGSGRGKGRLSIAPSRPVIAAALGVGWPTSTSSPSGGDGIASPLGEVPNTRNYHTPTALYSSDGLFTWVVYPVAGMTFDDALGRRVEFNLEDDISA